MCHTLWAPLIWLSKSNGVYKDGTAVTQCLCASLCNPQGIIGQRGAKGESGTRGTVVRGHV